MNDCLIFFKVRWLFFFLSIWTEAVFTKTKWTMNEMLIFLKIRSLFLKKYIFSQAIFTQTEMNNK